MRAVFDGRFKLVVNLLTSDELYDLETDPDEMVNLVESPISTSERDWLHDAVIEWMNRTRDPLHGYYWKQLLWRKDAHPASFHHTGKTHQREDEAKLRQLDYATGVEMTQATHKMHYNPPPLHRLAVEEVRHTDLSPLGGGGSHT